MQAAPRIDSWSHAARLDDEALVAAIVLASLPEAAAAQPAPRDTLLEALRARYEDLSREVAARARVDVLRDPTAVADFVDHAWDAHRIVTGLESWLRGAPRGPLRGYLEVKMRSLVLDYLRHRKRRGGPPREAVEERAAPSSPRDERTQALIEATRACLEAVPIRYRAPFKLQYASLFDVDERDLAQLEKTGRPAAAIRARLAGRRGEDGERLPLAEIAALSGIAPNSVGTYLGRAVRALEECVRRRMAREEAA